MEAPQTSRLAGIERAVVRLSETHTSLTYEELSFRLRQISMELYQARCAVGAMEEAARPRTQREIMGEMRAAFRRSPRLAEVEAADV